MDRLFRIFNELHIPCYLIFDYGSGDKKSPELLALAGENQDAPKSLLIVDSVACFPNGWEVDLKVEIPNSDAIAAEAKEKLGLREDSKPLIARYIARKLVSQNPPVVPPSLKSIIEKAVTVAWKKSCLQVTSSPESDKQVDQKDTGAA